jgi:predicted metal-dependent hydrolase
MAAETLLPWLKELSAETGLAYSQGRISSAATRWGSCSAKKRICLNFHLLFLPKDLARHVLIHELCHTIVLDHSIRFWRLLAQFDANSEVLRGELKKAQKYLPSWVMEE